MDQNPLLQTFDHPPFFKIENSHFKPAFEKSLKEARTEINTIVDTIEAPTFSNTIEALEFSGQKLGRISSIFFNLNSAETNTEIQKLAQEISPLLSEFSNDILLNADLFKKIKSVFKDKSNEDYSQEQIMLLEKIYKNFTRNGANLNQNDQNRLREIDMELSRSSLSFGENVLAETNNFELQIKDKSELDGIPDDIKESAKNLAEEKQKEGYIFTLDFPTFIPVMKFAENRELRKKLLLGFGSKGFKDNDYNNEENVLNIVRLRLDRANLLGYKSHADFVLQERMAKTVDTVHTFLDNILEKAMPSAVKELEELKAFAFEIDSIKDFKKWDKAYYTEKLKQKKFDLNEEVLKPYFELNRVIGGMFEVASKLYHLTFKEVSDLETYHEDVITYKVYDETNTYLATLYADFHPRAGKRDGAWMTIYKDQYKLNKKEERPQVSIVCNFTKPTKTKPSLLTFNEVTTLFHEFGHALHAMNANTTYPSLSGASVYWDFVELPSQLMENWCYESEALKLFARHYQTDEILPTKYIEKIKESSNFMEGLQTTRQVSFGKLDLAWHALESMNSIEKVKDTEDLAFKNIELLPDIESTCMSTAFGHIFQGGYSSGYYSYKWAEVLDADAFEYFKEKGIFNNEVAKKFRDNVLQLGGTVEPMALYKQFRGKEPNPDALLKRAGLIKS
ncbi:Zinc-dependent oligopeptidase A Dcp [Psychroflexus torquis ATCC 700755]|uniref:Zinc-dependent oligopeptidase A Dcp n=1 Tax=Psychroflexus torquis (strain ATCC 700755 / CIP 106069 / ACAM 623) TaxID=313595 RepID=K4IQ96_PSYTT|nr:M3 family metallopeptidase [Psychroflexus torquis]AFU67665.1 Zinc-dependent oligopeptidase A Dcp [Psychroflexus torquis ATCC 700755]